MFLDKREEMFHHVTLLQTSFFNFYSSVYAQDKLTGHVVLISEVLMFWPEPG